VIGPNRFQIEHPFVGDARVGEIEAIEAWHTRDLKHLSVIDPGSAQVNGNHVAISLRSGLATQGSDPFRGFGRG
jgi:hypothetical protein